VSFRFFRRFAGLAHYGIARWVAGRVAGLPGYPVVAVAAMFVAACAWIRLGPVSPRVLDQSRFTSVTVVDRNGIVLYEPLAKSGTRGEHLRAADLPENVVRATIAAEDRRFEAHAGVDPLAIARALIHDVKHLGIVEGGSTITQQVAKLLLQAPDRSLSQKIREAVLALRLEQHYSKPEILAMYLTLAPYGDRITGITRASRT
jgi:membrane peptidoglycan carboxypeptidase